ncbi:MAG: LysM peptidoglycan-binding domain-containing protein [Pseudomonadota bacterium]
MRSVCGLRGSIAATGKILAAVSFAALASGCGLSNSGGLWDDPQATGSVARAPAPVAADPIITGTNRPYNPYHSQAPQGRIVHVQPGDTAYSIAKRNRTTVQALAIANNLRAPYTISAGQRLVIPGPRADYTATGSVSPVRQPAPAARPVIRPAQVVTVRAGDTLYSIGRRYGVHVKDLARFNRIAPPYHIKLGQRIQIPSLQAAPQRAQAPRRPAPQVHPRRAPVPQAVASAPGRAASSPNRDYIYYFHKVKPGETLPAIAQQYRIETSTLATFNQLPAHAQLRSGQVIRVPM